MKYIDAEKLIAEIKGLKSLMGKLYYADYKEWEAELNGYNKILSIIDSLQQEQPEPYFYCKYGGILSLCSDCKRNHNNSSFKTEEITTWYSPSNGTKHCIDYIQQEQPEVDLEKELDQWRHKHFKGKRDGDYNGEYLERESQLSIARHFYELGLNARKK